MSAQRPGRWTRSVVALVLVLALALAPTLAGAQPTVGTAIIKAVTGQVEIQRKGDTGWVPAAVGARLAEGDQVRAHAGASAALDLPDGSTLFVAENSRIVVSKLEFDPQNQGRQAFFHLAVGKVRAAVSQAAIRLVKARQSNFGISTPTAVAAARGTVFEVVYDATQNVMRVAVIVTDPRRASGLVSCLSLQDRFSNVLVREGLATIAGQSGCAPPIPISLLPDASLVGTLANPIAPGPAFSIPISVPTIPDSGSPPPVIFTSDPGSATSPVPPSTIGVDIGQTTPTQESSSLPPTQ